MHLQKTTSTFHLRKNLLKVNNTLHSRTLIQYTKSKPHGRHEGQHTTLGHLNNKHPCSPNQSEPALPAGTERTPTGLRQPIRAHPAHSGSTWPAPPSTTNDATSFTQAYINAHYYVKFPTFICIKIINDQRHSQANFPSDRA